MCLLAQTASLLGDPERAELVYARLKPFEERVALSYMELSTGSVARELGLLATTMGRLDDAARHFQRALAVNERTGARPWLAHSQRDYAGMLQARDGAGDAARASELLSAALASYKELGMEPAGLEPATSCLQSRRSSS